MCHEYLYTLPKVAVFFSSYFLDIKGIPGFFRITDERNICLHKEENLQQFSYLLTVIVYNGSVSCNIFTIVVIDSVTKIHVFFSH